MTNLSLDKSYKRKYAIVILIKGELAGSLRVGTDLPNFVTR